MNKKALHFISDIYNQEYFFLKYWSREQFEKVLGISLNNSGGMTVFKDGVVYIWVESFDGPGISHLVHEVIHATNFTLGSRGVKVSAKDDEAQAYLAQWIFDNCYQSLKKSHKMKGRVVYLNAWLNCSDDQLRINYLMQDKINEAKAVSGTT